MSNIVDYLRQPTSVAGLSALIGLLMSALSGAMQWQTAAPLLVGAAVAIILPDNSVAKTAAATLAEQAIAAQRSYSAGQASLSIVPNDTTAL